MGYVLEAAYTNDQEPSILRTPEEIDQFIDDLLNAGWEHTAATVYAIDEETNADPEHELVIGVNKESGLGSLRYAGADGDWYSQGEQANPGGVEYAYFGTSHEFPNDSETPLGTVRQALHELLASGGQRPTCVVWQPAE